MSVLQEEQFLAYAGDMRPDLSATDLLELVECALARMTEHDTRLSSENPVARSHAMAAVLHGLSSCSDGSCGR